MRAMSIDPGSSGCGYAIWDDFGTEEDWKRMDPPIKIGSFPEQHGFANFWEKSCAMAFLLRTQIIQMNVRRVYCEIPTYMGNTGDGHAATADGSIYKLSMHIGAIQYVCFEQGIQFIGVPVREWKGQLPKKVLVGRIQKLFGEEVLNNLGIAKCAEHAWDGVGIGAYAKGHYFATDKFK